MTEPETAAEPERDAAALPPAAPQAASSEPPRARPHSVLGWVSLLGFLILVAAIALAWFYPRTPPASNTAEIAALDARITELANRLTASESREAALTATETRLAGAEKALAARPAPPGLAAIEARLAALEKRKPPAPDLAPIEARLAALEKIKPAAAAPPSPAELAASLAPLSTRLDKLEKLQASLAERIARLTTQLGTVTKRADDIATQLGEVTKRTDQSDRAARLATAAVALAQGRPLGILPGAPPSLARFASVAPPTLAALRLSFAAAARAEREAARAAEPGQSLAERMKDRLGDLLTLREGNKVIVGNPAEPALAGAATALDAGDLKAALAALATLTPPLAPPLQQWQDQAAALLAAESALASLSTTE